MSGKSSSTRQSKTPLNHLKSKKWCFPPSPLRSGGSGGRSDGLLSPSKSPEPNCAICLGKIEDKSFTDRCFHCFCRLCLFEWAKVKAECPVCRQAFEKIIFNIRAMDDYDEQVVQSTHRHRGFGPFHSHPPFTYGTPFVNLDGNPRFRYPTTLTPMRRRMMDFERRLQMQLHMTDYAHGLNFPQFMDFLDNRRSREHRSARSAAISNAINNNNILRNSNSNASDSQNNRSSTQSTAFNEYRHRYRHRGEDPMLSGHSSDYPRFYTNHFDMDIFPPPVGTSAHRRYIYDSDLYVMANGDGNSHRTREVSARFFSSNPACTHRLIPWLNRELNSILDNPSETETLIPRIMNALLMYDITSVGFKKIIAPFTLTKTDHFIHEFFNFARSPYDMDQYTRLAVYVPRHRADVIESEPLPAPIGFQIEANSSPNRSSPDSVLSSGSSIEILDQPFERVVTPNQRQITNLSPTLSLRVYSIDGSESSDSSTEIRQLITPSPVNTPSMRDSETVANNDVSSTSNPTPLPRGDLPDVNFGNIDIIDDFDNPKPGTSGLSRMRTLAQTKWSDSETTDVDVGQELEAAIARFENNGRAEVKKENPETSQIRINQQNDGNNSDSSSSSVLIVGYVKPLHERTPEFVNLISSEDSENMVENNGRDHNHKKSKKLKKDKHRKRSCHRSRSPSNDSHSKHKRKCKHRSKDRRKSKSRERHHHRHHRWNHKHRSSSTSSTSSFDELRQLNKSFLSKDDNNFDNNYNQRKYRKLSADSKHSRYETNQNSSVNSVNSSVNSPTDKRTITVVSTTTSTSRPSSLSSVVIRKEAPNNESLKYRPYLIYSDSDSD